MNRKNFIITIDTESDNQWDNSSKQSTENAKYIPRFQKLCEKYNFKPVYLVDYSMAQNTWLVDYLKKCQRQDKCEIGMHLHSWDTPPKHIYDDCIKSRPYLIEYPKELMFKKIETIHNLLTNVFECNIVSHRAGRWATNTDYLDILAEFGYKIDCSYTPGISWIKSAGATTGGSDYSKEKDEISMKGSKSSIMEVPMTLKKVHCYQKSKVLKDVVKEPIRFIRGRYWWLRPALSSNEMMLEVLNGRKQNFAEFMMHSSEMMPGGSPYFRTKEDIDKLFKNLDIFFAYVSRTYDGTTLQEYYTKYKYENYGSNSI